MFGLFRKKKIEDKAPELLRLAAGHFLRGETDLANRIVAKARAEHPTYFGELSMQTAELIEDLVQATQSATIVREESSDQYTNAHCRAYWQSAHDEIATRSPSDNVNALIFQLMTEKIAAAIDRLKPDAVLDFGCAYGRALFELAGKYPATPVYGVDRQAVWKELNDAQFERSNLEYISGNVFDALDHMPGQHKMLIHVRTGIMVYPAFLAKLYAQAREAGFRHVVLYEIASISADSWTFREQGSGFKSEAHRSTMFIHDYSAALREAGFINQKIERMPHAYRFPKNTMLEGDTYVYIEASCE